jgi:hypothetical protein
VFGQARQRKIRGTFCEEKLAAKSQFDPRSFRYKKSGKAWLLIGCPKGKWDPKGYVTLKTGKRQRGRCKAASTRAYTLLVPARARRCPAGSKRVRKG